MGGRVSVRIQHEVARGRRRPLGRTNAAGFDLLRGCLNDQETVEVLLVVGYYLGVALLAAAVDLDLDPPAQMAVVEAAKDEL